MGAGGDNTMTGGAAARDLHPLDAEEPLLKESQGRWSMFP
jgi:hypothetical protein